MRTMCLAAGVLMLFAGTLAFGQEQVVRLATLLDFAPFCFGKPGAVGGEVERIPPGTDSRHLQGYTWDIVRESFHSQNYTIVLELGPWVRVLELLERGRVDLVFPASDTPERRSRYAFSSQPVDVVSYTVYVRSGTPTGQAGLGSFAGKRLAVMREWSYGPVLDAARAALTLIPVDDVATGFRQLEAGRVDGFVGYEQSFDYYLSKAGLSGRFDKLPAFDSGSEYLIGPRQRTDVIRLLGVYDAGLRLLEANGKSVEAAAYWFGE